MPRGIPHSVFQSWSLRDQEKALAWHVLDQMRCARCGTIPQEWITDDDGEHPQFVIPPPFQVHEHFCGGCEERDRYEEVMYGKKRIPPGVSISLKRTDPGDTEWVGVTGPSLLDQEL